MRGRLGHAGSRVTVGKWTCAFAMLFALAATSAMPRTAHAFDVNNNTDKWVYYEVRDPSTENVAGSHDSKGEIGPHLQDSCPYTDDHCGDGNETKTLRATILVVNSDDNEDRDQPIFACDVNLDAGGFVSVRQYRRTYDGFMVHLPHEYVCDSRYDGPSGEQNVDLRPRQINNPTRNLQFLATADPQFENGEEDSSNDTHSEYVLAKATMEELANRVATGNYDGAIVAGDLTQNSRPRDEWKEYIDSISNSKPGDDFPKPNYMNDGIYWDRFPQGVGKYFFETGGNHDSMYPASASIQETGCGDDPPVKVCKDPDGIYKEIRLRGRMTVMDKVGGKDYGHDGHEAPGLYSWDWHDIHFVNLGQMGSNHASVGDGDPSAAEKCPLYPGKDDNNVAFTSCSHNEYSGPDPGRALDFLRDDLAENVGNSDRPVIIIQHYGLDAFSVGHVCAQDKYTDSEDGHEKDDPIPGVCRFEVWWTPSQQREMWQAFQDYNVVAMFSGHVHNGPDSSPWEQDFTKPDASFNGPASIPDFTAGGALNGVFVQVNINDTDCPHGVTESCLTVQRYKVDKDTSAVTKAGDPYKATISVPGSRLVPTISAINVAPSTLWSGQAVAYSATVTSPGGTQAAPTGTVSWSAENGDPIPGCQDLALTATCRENPTHVDSPRQITVTYSGDPNYYSWTQTTTVDIEKGQSGITLTAPTTAVSGQQVAIGMTAAPVPGFGLGTLTGNVEFYDGSTVLCDVGILLADNGHTVCNHAFTVAGSPHPITVHYSGNGNFEGQDASFDLTVSKGEATTTLQAPDTVVGQPVTFTVKVTGAPPAGGNAPDGVVQVSDDDGFLCSAHLTGTSGIGVCDHTYTAPGVHHLFAGYYVGTEFNDSSSDTVTQTTSPAPSKTTVSVSDNPVYAADTVDIRAFVHAIPLGAAEAPGTVDFTDNGKALCSDVPVDSGVAVCETAALRYVASRPAHPIVAVYTPDTGAFVLGSTSLAYDLTVNQRPTETEFVVSPNPARVNEDITFTVRVKSQIVGDGSVPGTVTLFWPDGSTVNGCTAVHLMDGEASCVDNFSATFNRTYKAVFAGGTIWGESEKSVDWAVIKADTKTGVTSSVNPSVSGQTIRLSAHVVGDPSGTELPKGSVKFESDGSEIESCGAVTLTTSSGNAKCNVAFTAAISTRTVTATFVPTTSFPRFNGSSGSLTQTIDKANTTTVISSDANPAVTGQPVTYTATVTVDSPGGGDVSGNVAFNVAGCSQRPVDPATGTATCVTSYASPGSHVVLAAFNDTDEFNESTSSAITETVDKASTSTTLVPSANPAVVGQPVTLSAQVAPVAPGGGVPSGTVTFKDGGAVISGCDSVTLDGTGTATCPVSYATVTSRTLTAVYSGSTAYLGSPPSDPVSLVVNKASSATTLTSGTNPSVSGQSVTLTAHVAVVNPGATSRSGTVAFKDGTTTISGCGAATVDTVSGSATCTTSFQAAGGTRSLTATYGGSATLADSTSTPPVSQVVNKASSTTTLTSSANPSVSGQSVTLTAKVAVTAPGSTLRSGTVSFQDAGTPISGCGAAAVDTATGSASCTTGFQAAGGTRALTAVYSGNTNLATSTSAPAVSQAVNKAASTTTLTSSANPSVTAQAVTFTAKVAVTAPGSTATSGTMSFQDGTTPISGCGAATVDQATGIATCTTSFLAVNGNRTLRAVYSGNTNLLGSTSGSLSQTVNRAEVSIAISQTPDHVALLGGFSVTLTVSPRSGNGPTPTGMVSFPKFTLLGLLSFSDTNQLAGGKAAFSSTKYPGAYPVNYTGDGNYLPLQTTYTPQ